MPAGSRRLVRVASVLLAVAPSVSTVSRAQTLPQEYRTLIRSEQNAGSLDAGLLGDRIDYYTGHVDFVATDASVPGSSALPFAIGRRYSVDANPSGVVPERAFGDWDLEIPHIEGIVASGVGWTVAGADPNARCSAFAGAPAAIVSTPSMQHAGTAVTTSIPWEQYAIGYRLAVPGKGRRELLKRAPANVQQPTSGQWPIVTSDWWMIGCLSQLDPASPGDGEGFVALAPDGTKYTFNWLATRPHVPLSRPADTEEPGVVAVLDRDDAWMMATKVEDRFGNWVKYQYDPNKPLQLRQITSNDGRTLTVSYTGTTNIVHSISDGTRTWTYGYAFNGSYYTLTTVTLPDGSKWQIDFEPLNHLDWSYANPWTCGSPGTPIVPAGVPGTITHPGGAKGAFTFNVSRRGRSGAPAGCYTNSAGMPFASVQPTVFDTLALTQKKITGPRLPAALTWSIAYAGCSGSSCAAAVTTTVTDPRGAATRYTFGTGYEGDEGLLTKTERGGSGGTYLESETLQYVPATGQSWPAELGTTTQARGDAVRLTALRPLKQRATTRQSATFTYAASNLDAFGFAQTIVRTGSDTKSEALTYAHNKAKWVLGTTKKIISAGQTELDSALDAQNQPTSVSGFGDVVQTFAWNGDGTLQWSKDGAGHKTTYSNWYRGIPKNTGYATGEAESVAVSPTGLVTGWTDERGSVTSYDHDAGGRLSGIHYPAGDPGTGSGQAFAATTIAWSTSASGWSSTESTDTYQKTTLYDALMRPTLINENGARYINMAYDGDGGIAFASVPSAIANESSGTTYKYDDLGRLTQQNFAGNVTTWAYQPGFVTRVSDPNGTTYFHYQTHDAPTTASPVSIDGPEYATSIDRDAWGRVHAVTRGGVPRKWTWSGRFVCATYSPERGTAVYQRDGAGNVSASADLVGDTGCNLGGINSTNKVSRTWDSRNRLLTVDYPGGSEADLVQTWWPNGRLHTTERSGTGRTFNYNRRGLLTFERLAIDGDVFEIDTDYNTRGQPATLTYPDATAIDYAPNAWGEPTKIGAYATGITYFPNGAVKGFAYGNGVTHALTQDARQLPQHASDAAILDVDYGYDGVGNVTSLTDHLGAHTDSVMMSYDGANRLKTANATALWGNAAFTYDDTDNLKTANIGGVSTTFTIDATTNRASAMVSGGVTTPLQYDGQGHLKQKGAQAYAFDRADLLVDIPGAAHYRYEADGKRAVSEGNGTKHFSVYDSRGRSLMDVEPGLAPGCSSASERIFCSSFEKPAANLAATRYVYLGRHPIAKDGPDGRRYLHTDALGSLMAESDGSKLVTNRYHYQPFGKPVGTAPAGPGYAGAQTDASGLSYMLARYYDPELARFLSTDPVSTDPESGNDFGRYAYAENSPYGKYDPNGRYTCDATESDCEVIDEAIGRLQDAVANPALSDQQQANLDEIHTFYGNEGSDNGVKLTTESHASLKGATGGTVTDGAGVNIGIRIRALLGDSNDVTSEQFRDRLAAVVAHEGQHGVDQKSSGMPFDRMSEKAAELRGASTESAMFQGLNSPHGPWLWTPERGLQPGGIEREAENSTELWCRNRAGGCP